ncbi:MAG TPA: hypothetical protein VGH82_04425 [Gaiellaceae bacterium]
MTPLVFFVDDGDVVVLERQPRMVGDRLPARARTAMKALIRVGRLYTGEPVPAGETRYQRGCMRILPGRIDPIPLIVDHNVERQIGLVDVIIELDGWLAFRCTLQEAPSWLRKGTGASAGYKVLHRQQLGDGERVLDAILDEVTVTVGQTPVNAGARVMLLRDDEIEHTRGVIRRDGIGRVLAVR